MLESQLLDICYLSFIHYIYHKYIRCTCSQFSQRKNVLCTKRKTMKNFFDIIIACTQVLHSCTPFAKVYNSINVHSFILYYFAIKCGEWFLRFPSSALRNIRIFLLRNEKKKGFPGCIRGNGKNKVKCDM